MNANILNIDGNVKGNIELPVTFSEVVRPDIIMRAVLAENSLKLQPQGHAVLAGLNTTARYYGTMSSYRSGRHMGVAIRPRQKLGGGIQGDVRRIPSAFKGRRAHPHKIEKILIENINKKEYQKAIRSAIAATSKIEYVNKRNAVDAKTAVPIIISDNVESITKTRELLKVLSALKLTADVEKNRNAKLRKGQRRMTRRRIFKKAALIVVGEDKGVLRAARNIPGVDVCTVGSMKAGLLAPGGHPGRVTVWSESAIKKLEEEIPKISLV